MSKNSNNQKGRVDSFLLSIVVITVIILGGVMYLGSKMGETTEVVTDDRVELRVDSNEHDWGEIDIDGGIVVKSFTITNKSEVPLQLFDVVTSCMCTTAQLKTTDRSSKKFGMHEKNSSVFEVSAGETVELVVEFDPAYHGPSGIGSISRTVTMSTNDADNPTLSFGLTANVVKGAIDE